MNMVINSPLIYISWGTLLNQSKLRIPYVGCSLISLRVRREKNIYKLVSDETHFLSFIMTFVLAIQ
jgi:hypothetical protein